VFVHDPFGSQNMPAAFVNGAQQLDWHWLPSVQGTAQYAWAPTIVVLCEQTPEQQAFGVDVHSMPGPRHALPELLPLAPPEDPLLPLPEPPDDDDPLLELLEDDPPAPPLRWVSGCPSTPGAPSP
jgi:hypothetical protein